MSFAEDIKNLRKRNFLTQEEFGKRLGVSFATINRWETGRTKPNLETMKKIKQFCYDNDIVYINLESEWLEEEEK